MKLTDLLPPDAWFELEQEITKQTGLSGNIFDAEGVRITNYRNWANRLCPEIKANDKGQSFICAVAHQNLAAQAKRTRKPLIEECDAGIAKPDSRIYKKLVKESGLKPHEILFVGERLNEDVMEPKKAGMSSLWLSESKKNGIQTYY